MNQMFSPLPSMFDLQVAARTIWAEARGEIEQGQRAVANVLVNRLKDGRWGKTLAEVCVAPKQFSCMNDGDPNRAKLFALHDDDPFVERAIALLQEALFVGPDPTQGAMHYFNPALASPPWAFGKSFSQIGNHRFVRDVA